MQPSIHRFAGARWTATRRASDSRLVCTHEVKPEAVLMSSGQRDLTDVSRLGSRVGIQGVGEAPAPRFLAVVLDLVSNSADPVPAVGLHCAEPRSSEASVSHDYRLAARGQD